MAVTTGGAELEAGGEGEQGAPKPRPLWKRMPVIAAAALLLAGVLGGGIYYLMFAGSTSGAAGKSADKPASVAPAVTPAFLDLPEVMVNLSVAGNERTQYLKLRAVLEIADPTLAPKIQPYLPRIVDAFQVFLRELRPSDLEGSAGIYRLREELTRRVNAAIAPLQVNAVLFKEMVIQ